jgi:hypothetical protein
MDKTKDQKLAFAFAPVRIRAGSFDFLFCRDLF